MAENKKSKKSIRPRFQLEKEEHSNQKSIQFNLKLKNGGMAQEEDKSIRP